MEEIIELTIESPGGIIDCRLEPERNDGKLIYSATILYPNVVNGFGRSEIYCHNVIYEGGAWGFAANDEGVHPKIEKLEAQIADAIIEAQRSAGK